MSQPLPYQITNDTVMVVVDGEAHEVDKSQPNYEPLRQAIIQGRWEDVPNHLTVGQVIEDWADGEFTVVDGDVYYQDEALPSALNKRILETVAKGENPQPIMRFWERLDENPSYRSRNQLYDFLMRHPGIPFTEDGFILFYKGVRRDFRDCHSGKFDNSPGQKLFMKRNRVSDDPTKACHFGFHVGARSYAVGFGHGQTVICKVDPADVVCVPNDCAQAKVRIHRYEVVGVDAGELMPDTQLDVEVIVPVKVDPETGEPPVDPNEPLVADPAMDGEPKGQHTDGTPMEAGETLPMVDGTEGAVTLPLTGTEWDFMNDLDPLALMEKRIMPLRAYARFNCLMVGASKMRGGKTVLIPAICKARGYSDPVELEPEAEVCDECGGNPDLCGC
jgi:hypothetical protein